MSVDCESSRVEGRARCLRPEIERGNRPRVVARAEGGQLTVLRERNGKVTPTHADRAMEFLQALDIEVLRHPFVTQRRDQRLPGRQSATAARGRPCEFSGRAW